MDTLDSMVTNIFETRQSAWEQAGATTRIFLQQVAQLADPTQEYGYEVSAVRKKRKDRAVAKLRHKIVEKRVDELGLSAEDIEDLISDWVGLKVTANTSTDAFALIDKLEKQCRSDHRIRFAKKDGKDDIVDYISTPKDTGYRAYHAVLLVEAYQNAKRCEIKVEVQVKTRLQDAWGELTHESFYKTDDGPTPREFHDSIARTMADLLATVDKLADDLSRDLNPSAAKSRGVRAGTAGAADGGSEPEIVEVVFVHPRYALAKGHSDEDKGLVPTVELRDVLVRMGKLPKDKFISIDDFLKEGDRLIAIREERPSEGNRVFHPVELLPESSDSTG